MSNSELLFCRGGIDVVDVALATQKQADYPTKDFIAGMISAAKK
jgi:hypothetical protein